MPQLSRLTTGRAVSFEVDEKYCISKLHCPNLPAYLSFGWAGGCSAGESGWPVGTSQVRWAAGGAGGAGG